VDKCSGVYEGQASGIVNKTGSPEMKVTLNVEISLFPWSKKKCLLHYVEIKYDGTKAENTRPYKITEKGLVFAGYIGTSNVQTVKYGNVNCTNTIDNIYMIGDDRLVGNTFKIMKNADTGELVGWTKASIFATRK